MRKLLRLLPFLAVLVLPLASSGCRMSRKFFDNLTASPSFYGSYQIHEGRQNDAVFGASITFYERGERPAIPAVPHSYSNDIRVYGSSSSSSSASDSKSYSSQSQNQNQDQDQSQKQGQHQKQGQAQGQLQGQAQGQHQRLGPYYRR